MGRAMKAPSPLVSAISCPPSKQSSWGDVRTLGPTFSTHQRKFGLMKLKREKHRTALQIFKAITRGPNRDETHRAACGMSPSNPQSELTQPRRGALLNDWRLKGRTIETAASAIGERAAERAVRGPRAFASESDSHIGQKLSFQTNFTMDLAVAQLFSKKATFMSFKSKETSMVDICNGVFFFY